MGKVWLAALSRKDTDRLINRRLGDQCYHRVTDPEPIVGTGHARELILGYGGDQALLGERNIGQDMLRHRGFGWDLQ